MNGKARLWTADFKPVAAAGHYRLAIFFLSPPANNLPGTYMAAGHFVTFLRIPGERSTVIFYQTIHKVTYTVRRGTQREVTIRTKAQSSGCRRADKYTSFG